MPAYIRSSLQQFIAMDLATLIGRLEASHARDGYASQFSQQILAWADILPLLQDEFRSVQDRRSEAATWAILLEFPIYRLRKRIDAVILAGDVIVVMEMKVGSSRFLAEDERQVEEYALDLRDFHRASHERPILPLLWCTGADSPSPVYTPGPDNVSRVHCVGREGLAALLVSVGAFTESHSPMAGEEWDQSEYRPVPNVIDAATSIFSGHDVRMIAQSDASNLKEAAARLVELIAASRRLGHRIQLFLTGVPGSGKTLAGLQVVHDATAAGVERPGDIVYLSGNTPLVTVLREALARDEFARRTRAKAAPLRDIRRATRTRIQHINDFLKDGIRLATDQPPHEHAVVFDEAQRAWDERQGQKKFDRNASEPALMLELMGRHRDWCACICLVGGGQEINSGERGIAGWGEALRSLSDASAAGWSVHAPVDVLVGGPSTAGDSLGVLPDTVPVFTEPGLQLLVPLRSYRSSAVSEWVAAFLDGRAEQASSLAKTMGKYPVKVTRSLQAARQWLRVNGRGTRRFGLAASSGARRLRADGLGVMLSATDGVDIAHWYLNPPGDIRSSFALEVPANEYTTQGLELDFVGVCWGGDLLRNSENTHWISRALSGTRWQIVANRDRRRFIQNSYRVLLTRAREGIVIWIPQGDEQDPTRDPLLLDATDEFLVRCGAQRLDPM